MRMQHAALGVAILAPALYLAVLNAANSPVADAAMRGDAATVRTLLQQGADVNAPQADGATAIQWAAYRNDLQLADVLLAAKADVKLANHDGATPLRLAATNGSRAMLAKLIDAGANPNEPGPNGETPLMYASRNGSPEAVKLLIDRGAEVNAREKIRGTSALMWAVSEAHPEAVKILLDRGADFRAASNPDTKGARAYLAPSIRQRAEQDKNIGKNRNRNGDAKGKADGKDADVVAEADAAAADAAFGRTRDTDGGGLTPLIFAARQNCLECARLLLDAGADINQTSKYGWTPLLTATQNRHYKLASFLLERGADPNIKNHGGWSPLYLATDNRNIEAGDYPVPKADLDHLEFIKLLIAKGADVNARVCGIASTPAECAGDSTETRTNFTMQWLNEDGATPFLRAAQSSDTELMTLLLDRGADPKITTQRKISALAVASGIGWVEGVTYEWSKEHNLKAVKMLLDLGLDPNLQDLDGRAALHGAAHKGRNDIVQLLVDGGGKLDLRDQGSRDTFNGDMKGVTWIPLHYAQGLVRVGVQSAIAHPETAAFMKELMQKQGLEIPPDITSSICLTKGVKGCQ
jgi:uncharacterized protein